MNNDIFGLLDYDFFGIVPSPTGRLLQKLREGIITTKEMGFRPETERKSMIDTDDIKHEKTTAPIPAGFPWALVIQILMAVLTYLIQNAILPNNTKRFRELKSRLELYQPVFHQGKEEIQ